MHDDDSAISSTNGAIDEQIDHQQNANCTSPLPSHQTASYKIELNTQGKNINSIKSLISLERKDSERRDSLNSSAATGFQNRFASIMKQKIEERSKQSVAFPINSSNDTSIEGESSIDLSDAPTDIIHKVSSKKGKTKWMAAVVCIFQFTFMILSFTL